MGHFDDASSGERYQVTDTPGLLARADAERNDMEGLTLAALEHLDNVVLFVVDLTGECGTGVRAQLEVRSEIRERFPQKRCQWIDVFTKADLFCETGLSSNPINANAEMESGSQQQTEIAQGKYHLLDKDYPLALEQVPDALWVSTPTGKFEPEWHGRRETDRYIYREREGAKTLTNNDDGDDCRALARHMFVCF